MAQSEGYTGKPFVRYFVHNALLQMGQEKMSKSLGNLVSVREALDRWGADAMRLFVLSSHYRSPLTYSEEALEAAKKGAERIGLALSPLKAGKGEPSLDPEPFQHRFLEAMDDDLNTPRALAALFDLAREINIADEREKDAASARQALNQLWHVLGLTVTYRVSIAAVARGEASVRAEKVAGVPPVKHLLELLEEMSKELHRASLAQLIPQVERMEESAQTALGALVRLRDGLRQAREYALADKLRQRLGELGVVLEDTPQGTVWRYSASSQGRVKP